MIALGIILAILVIIAMLPVGARALYDMDGAGLWLVVGSLRIRLYPLPQKKKRKSKKPGKKKEEPKEPSQQAASGGNVERIKQILQPGIVAGKRFLNGIVIDKLTVYYQITDEDPAKAAIQYGVGWSAIGLVTGSIESVFKVRQRDLQVFVSFEQESKKRIYVLAQLTIRVWRLLYIGIGFGIEFLKIMLKNRKNKSVNNASTNA